ncbi:hypothetical protein EMPS_00017 [Entomortierella parvispora]|uniref:F-box domain-containing protein n=1 Tax=Entomortierella parvispora TaxID=205924 RepID=A0A9P3GYW7_9FUNG|nr:hypothetical protein EMPS_00017 [Entomortierella parvispora]
MIVQRFPDNLTAEILALIADLLTPKNLAVCLRVCKHWSKVFHPLFWRNMSITSPTTNRWFSNAPDNKLIQTNAPLVRSLRCHFFTSLTPFFQAKKMTNLSRLDLWGLVLPNDNKAILWVPLLNLIARNPGLRFLAIYNLLGTADNLAAKIFPSLPNLQVMKLHAGRPVSAKSLDAFLMMLPPSVLYLKVDASISGGEKYVPAPSSHGPRMKLRRLACSGFMFHTEAVLNSFLKRCPDLETMICEGTLSKLKMNEPRPRLQNFVMKDSFGWGTDGIALDNWIGPMGLRSLILDDKCTFGVKTVETILKHRSTLEELRVTQVQGTHIVSLLKSCPRLSILSTGSKTAGEPTAGGRDSLASIIRDVLLKEGMAEPPAKMDYTVNAASLIGATPVVWPCAGTLRTLEMILANIPRPDLQGVMIHGKMLGPYPDSLWIESRDMQRQIYERLGHCTKLRKLILGVSLLRSLDVREANSCIYEGLEFSLDSGLGLLSGLTDLRVLDVQMLEHKIGIPELEWMKTHWKKLERIVGLEPDETSLKWIKKHKPAWIRPEAKKPEDEDYVPPQKTGPFKTWTLGPAR